MRAIAFLTIGFALLGAAAVRGQEASPPQTPPQTQLSPDKPVSMMNEEELIQLATRLRDTGRTAEARAALRILLTRNDRNLEALNLDGEIALSMPQADVPGARMSFLAAIKIQPSDFRANFGLAQTWFRTRSWRQAQIYLETAARTAPSDKLAELNSMLAQCYRANGMRPEAYAAVEKALAADPSSLDAREIKIALLSSELKFDEALVTANELVELNRTAVSTAADKRAALIRLHGAHNIRLSVLQEKGKLLYEMRPDGTVTDVVREGFQRQAAELTKRVMDDYIVLNELNRTLQFFTIISFAERVVTFTPDDADAWLKLGMLYRNTYQDQAAANVMARVLQLDPDNEAAKRELETLPPPTQVPTTGPATQPAPGEDAATATAPAAAATP